MRYIIAYDLGTGGTKASLFDQEGTNLASAFVGCETFYPEKDFHEQRPSDWWESVVTSTKALLQQVVIQVEHIVGIAVSGHSLGVVPISKSSELLAEYVPIWSDKRASKEAEKFFECVDQENWYLTTGNGFPAAHYSIFKIMWYQKHFSHIYDDTHAFIGTKDYINYKMTGNICTDHSYASGSGVYDLKQGRYRQDYIVGAGIDGTKLPPIINSTEVVGTLTLEAAKALGLTTATKVVCGGVDNACMALGAGCIQQGEAYTSLGSSAWIAVAGTEPIVEYSRKPYVFAHCIPGHFVSATAIFAAGSAYKWVKENLCQDLVDKATKENQNTYEWMNELATQSPPGAKGLFFNPSLAGGAGNDASDSVKGAFVGIDLGHKKEDFIRATLEGICMDLKVARDYLATYTPLTDDMLIVGGGSKSPFWCQLFADIYNQNIVTTNIGQEAGAVGAAILAGIGVGLWDDFEVVKHMHTQHQTYVPNEETCEFYENQMPVFQYIAEKQKEIACFIQQTTN